MIQTAPVDESVRDVRRLSKRGREVIAARDAAMLRMSQDGHGIRAIAAESGLSQATVARIIRKQKAQHP